MGENKPKFNTVLKKLTSPESLAVLIEDQKFIRIKDGKGLSAYRKLTETGTRRVFFPSGKPSKSLKPKADYSNDVFLLGWSNAEGNTVYFPISGSLQELHDFLEYYAPGNAANIETNGYWADRDNFENLVAGYYAGGNVAGLQAAFNTFFIPAAVRTERYIFYPLYNPTSRKNVYDALYLTRGAKKSGGFIRTVKGKKVTSAGKNKDPHADIVMKLGKAMTIAGNYLNLNFLYSDKGARLTPSSTTSFAGDHMSAFPVVANERDNRCFPKGNCWRNLC